jgi:general stress protein 26
MSDKEKRIKIRRELKKVGVTSYGLMKSESKFLYHSIGDNETILGVVYGKYSGGSAFLIATNLRIIFFDKKPFVNVMDEIAYRVVSGVTVDSAFIPYATVVLHTKMGDYSLKYVNQRCANIFAKVIQENAIERFGPEISRKEQEEIDDLVDMDANALAFLRKHNIGVFASVSRSGQVMASAMHYLVGSDASLYFLTKENTHKVKNIRSNNQVAFTVFDNESKETVQISGTCLVETNQKIMQHVFKEVTSHYSKSGKSAPVAHLNKGKYVVLKLVSKGAYYSDFSSARI